MRSLSSILGPNDEWVFVGDSQIEGLPRLRLRQQIIADVLTDPKWADVYLAYQDALILEEHFTEVIAESDWLRLYLATQYDNMVYVDADCKLLRRDMGCPTDKPAFAGQREDSRRIDSFLFVTNGEKEWFASLLRKLSASDAVERVTLYKLLNTYRVPEEVGRIDPAIFTHVGAGKWR